MNGQFDYLPADLDPEVLAIISKAMDQNSRILATNQRLIETLCTPMILLTPKAENLND